MHTDFHFKTSIYSSPEVTLCIVTLLETLSWSNLLISQS